MKVNLNVVKHRKVPFIISGIFFLTSLAAIAVFGLRLGIDFTGGTLMQVAFDGTRPERAQIEETLATLELDSVSVQPADDDAFLIKTQTLTEDQHQAVLQTLEGAYQTEETSVEQERLETIGPTISSELSEKSWKAGIAVVLAIIIFVAYSFRKVSKPIASWKYGITAIIALVHDVVITMGVFAVLGYTLGVEIDIPFVVALLTILGYSVNDTIVVFDRIREKLLQRGASRFDETVAIGVQETIPRSINTSLTTLLVLAALFFFGGDSIHYFSLALLIGVAFGTYSSIFLASPLLVVWEEMKQKRREVKTA